MSLGLSVTSCGPPADFSSKKLKSLKECSEPDQMGSYFLSDVKPRARIFMDSEFSSDQIHSIEDALRQWNTAVEGIPTSVMTAEIHSIRPRVRGADFSRCEGDDRSEGDIYVVHVKEASRWDALKIKHDNPAVTMTCTKDYKLVHQTVLLNTAFVKSEQFYSVILHELGHSRGLDHSCQLNSFGTPGYVGCNKVGASHPYTLAVMFPTLGPNLRGGLEVKESLEKNDINRAQCAAKAHSSW